MPTPPQSIATWTAAGANDLPGRRGMRCLSLEPSQRVATFALRQTVEARNG